MKKTISKLSKNLITLFVSSILLFIFSINVAGEERGPDNEIPQYTEFFNKMVNDSPVMKEMDEILEMDGSVLNAKKIWCDNGSGFGYYDLYDCSGIGGGGGGGACTLDSFSRGYMDCNIGDRDLVQTIPGRWHMCTFQGNDHDDNGSNSDFEKEVRAVDSPDADGKRAWDVRLDCPNEDDGMWYGCWNLGSCPAPPAAPPAGGGGGGWLKGQTCGLKINIDVDPLPILFDCQGHDPSVSCPAGFQKTGADWEANGDRYWNVCIATVDIPGGGGDTDWTETGGDVVRTTGDVGITNDLAVGDDLGVTNNASIGGDLTVNNTINTKYLNTPSVQTTDTGLVAGAIVVGPLNAAGIVAGNITATAIVATSISAVAKMFEIEHPTKEGYKLIHSSLEGPEIGVYYRGTGRLQEGKIEITLPDYFEALTRKEGRTVLLTAKGKEPFLLSASDVENGSFSVYGTKSDGEFYWEVKAERADVEPLVVEKYIDK